MHSRSGPPFFRKNFSNSNAKETFNIQFSTFSTFSPNFPLRYSGWLVIARRYTPFKFQFLLVAMYDSNDLHHLWRIFGESTRWMFLDIGIALGALDPAALLTRFSKNSCWSIDPPKRLLACRTSHLRGVSLLLSARSVTERISSLKQNIPLPAIGRSCIGCISTDCKLASNWPSLRPLVTTGRRLVNVSPFFFFLSFLSLSRFAISSIETHRSILAD